MAKCSEPSSALRPKNNKQGCKQPSSDGSMEAAQPSSEIRDDLFYCPAISQWLQLIYSTEHERCIDWHFNFLKLPPRTNTEFPLNCTRKPLHRRESTIFRPKPFYLNEIQVLISAFIHEKFWNSWHRFVSRSEISVESSAGGGSKLSLGITV